jgi:hypothetical protein
MDRLGLFLLRVVVWATDRLSHERRRPADYLIEWAAHAALGGVAIIGSVVDWATLREASYVTRARPVPANGARDDD